MYQALVMAHFIWLPIFLVGHPGSIPGGLRGMFPQPTLMWFKKEKSKAPTTKYFINPLIKFLLFHAEILKVEK